MTFTPNLLNLRTTDGNGTALQLNHRQTDTNAVCSLHMWGTFGTATLKIQGSPDGVNWLDIPNSNAPTTYTYAGIVNIVLKAAYLRAVVASSDVTTSLSMHAY